MEKLLQCISEGQKVAALVRRLRGRKQNDKARAGKVYRGIW